MITAEDILSDLKTTVYRTVAAAHGETLALACARAVLDCLYLNFRRQYIYVPTPSRKGWQARYELIWQDFTGHNHAELATKYRVSTQWIYRVVAQMRQEHIKHRQADLFPLADDADNRQTLLAVLQDYLPADLQRAGLADVAAAELADGIAAHVTATYPGISFKITGDLWRSQRGDDNHDLFDETG